MGNRRDACPEGQCIDMEAIVAKNARLRAALAKIRDGFGPNHLSKFCRDTAIDAIGKRDD